MSQRSLVARLGAFIAFIATSSAATEIKPAVDQRIRSAMAEVVAAGAPGVIVLVRDGDAVLQLAVGSGNLSPKVPMDVANRTRVGSLAKTFVAVVVLQLVSEGKLRLDDAVERIVPGLVPAGAGITVRQLLNHTSGIFDYWQDDTFFGQLIADPTQLWPPEKLVEIANRHPLRGRPGENWSYSNTNYILLGRIIEVTTRHPLEVELRARVFDPLKLGHTSFDNSPQMSGSFAHGYALLGEPAPVDVTMVNPTAAWAAGGGIVSTAQDVATFYAALMGGRLLPTPLLDEMLTTVPAREGVAYGLGIAEVRVPCGSGWGHQGEFPGYLNFALSSKDGNRQAIVLVNFYSLPGEGQAAFHRLVASAFCG
jgi:D-alanyl-D-alanine carboxypeptidase